jgi:uncharacterized protein (DUF58 family)
MFFGKRFIVLVLDGSLFAFLSLIPGAGAFPILAYNLLLLILFVIDYSITPAPQEFEIRRETEKKLSLNVWNDVYLIVKNPAKTSLMITIRDSIPESFETDKEKITFKADAEESKTVLYKVKPRKRGEYTFLDLHFRYTGVLGLCVKSKTFNITGNVRVYPNLEDMRNKNLIIASRKKLTAGLQKIRRLGIGTEFESIRDYTPADDYRHINWDVTAREGRLFVNQYEPERNQHIYLMIDTGRVMAEEIGGISRLDYAVNTAFLVAETILYRGDNIGLITFDSEIHRLVKTGKGMRHFQKLADSMYNIEVNEAAADYDEAFSTLQKTQNRRSLVLLFTNPTGIEHAREIVMAWQSYAPGHKVILLTIENPVLANEAGKKINKPDDAFIKSAAIKLLDDRRRTFSIMEMSGMPVLESSPDSFVIDAVNRSLTAIGSRSF